ncbi:MAG: hypothetical protein ABIB46_01205 [bacterium]
MLKKSIILVFLFCIGILYADYFPLNIGNKWEYSISGYIISYDEITGIEVINGKTYYIQKDSYGNIIDKLRAENNNVYYYYSSINNDLLLYKFNANVGEKWNLNMSEMVSRTETVITPAGTYTNCLHIVYFYPYSTTKIEYWFADNIGIVKKRFWNNENSTELLLAKSTIIPLSISDTNWGSIKSLFK